MTVEDPNPTNDAAEETPGPGEASPSTSIDDTGESPFVNRAAQGYTGGVTTPHDYESEDNHGMGFVNPPPHMQERARTHEEEAEIRRGQNEAVAVPADFGRKPAVEGQNIPGTPETAQESVISAEDEANRAQNTPSGPAESNNLVRDAQQAPSTMPSSPLFEGERDDATETGV